MSTTEHPPIPAHEYRGRWRCSGVGLASNVSVETKSDICMIVRVGVALRVETNNSQTEVIVASLEQLAFHLTNSTLFHSWRTVSAASCQKSDSRGHLKEIQFQSINQYQRLKCVGKHEQIAMIGDICASKNSGYSVGETNSNTEATDKL